MAWKDMKPKDQRAWAVIVVFAIIIGYFSLAWAGVVPDDYNVVEHYFGEAPVVDDNTTAQTGDDISEVAVTGIPSIVNLTESEVNTYEIQFMAVDGGSEDYCIRLMVRNSLTNATFELSALDSGWMFSDEGDYAQYMGGALVPYETTSVTLTVTGDEFTRPGSVMVVCSSDGRTVANEGLITVIT